MEKIYVTPNGTRVSVVNGAATNLSTGETQYIDSVPESWKIETQGQAGALPPGHAPPPLPQKREYGILSFFDTFGNDAYENYKSKGYSNAQSSRMAVPAKLAGGALDVGFYAFSPFRAGLKMAAAKFPSFAAIFGQSAKPQSAISAFSKNTGINTGDAALLNNAERLAMGEDVDFGAAEILGGLAGAAVQTPGTMQANKEFFNSANFASKKNANKNFAKRHTKNADGEEAVEEVLEANIRPGETPTQAKLRIREEKNEANRLFNEHFEANKEKYFNATPQEILRDLENYVAEKSLGLGGSWTGRVTDEARAAFIDELRDIMAYRFIRQGVSPRIANNKAMNLEVDELMNDVGKLSLYEMDLAKKGMQGRTSAYNRGEGTQERMALESMANKHGSEGLLNYMGNYEGPEDSFWKWFKDSKVVDENGKPLKVYHGARTTDKFDEFKNSENFFTDNRKVAEMFASENAYILNVDGKKYPLSTREAENLVKTIEHYEEIDWGLDWNLLDNDSYGGKKGMIKLLNGLIDDGGIQNGIRTFKGAKDVRIERSPNDIFEVFLNMKNPKEIDFKGKTWTTDKEFGLDKMGDHDGVIAKNIREGGLLAEINGEDVPLSTTFIVKDPSKIKFVDDVLREASELQKQNLLSKEDVQKYMALNKLRSDLIGTGKIVGDASSKYEAILAISNSLAQSLKRYSNLGGTISRGAVSRGSEDKNEDYGIRSLLTKNNLSKQDNTKTFFTPPSENQVDIFEPFRIKPRLGE